MIPTEPIGSLPRPLALIQAVERVGSEDPSLDPLYEDAIRDSIERFEATGSPVITDGEQRKYPTLTYCVHGLLTPRRVQVSLTAGHPLRSAADAGPFRYNRYAQLARVAIDTRSAPQQPSSRRLR